MYFLQVDFATPAFDDLLRLRYEVLRKPLNLQFTIEQITSEADDFHFGCYDHHGILIGTLLMKIISSKELKMRQVAVCPKEQSRGVGSFMVKRLEAWMLASTNYSTIQLAAREEAVTFYKRLGYKVVGQPFTEVGIPHRQMTKSLL